MVISLTQTCEKIDLVQGKSKTIKENTFKELHGLNLTKHTISFMSKQVLI